MKPVYEVLPPSRLGTTHQPPVIANAYGCAIFSHHPSGRFAITVHNRLTAELTRDEALALAAWIIHRAERK